MIVLGSDHLSGSIVDIKVSSSSGALCIKAQKKLVPSHLPVGTVFPRPREAEMSQGCLAETPGMGPKEATTCPSSTHNFWFQGRLFSFAYIFIFVVLGD